MERIEPTISDLKRLETEPAEHADPDNNSGSDDRRSVPLSPSLLVFGVVLVWGYGIAAEHGPEALMPWSIIDWQSWYSNVHSSLSTASLLLSLVLATFVFLICSSFTGLRDKRMPRQSSKLFLLTLLAIQVWSVNEMQSKEEKIEGQAQLKIPEQLLEIYGDDSVGSQPATSNDMQPVMIEEGVRFDKFVQNGLNQLFEFTLTDLDINEIDPLFLSGEHAAEFRYELCNDPPTRSILDMDGEFEYLYRDMNGKDLRRIFLDRRDCL